MLLDGDCGSRCLFFFSFLFFLRGREQIRKVLNVPFSAVLNQMAWRERDRVCMFLTNDLPLPVAALLFGSRQAVPRLLTWAEGQGDLISANLRTLSECL